MVAVLLSFPVAMALATGTEAPATAQLSIAATAAIAATLYALWARAGRPSGIEQAGRHIDDDD